MSEPIVLNVVLPLAGAAACLLLRGRLVLLVAWLTAAASGLAALLLAGQVMSVGAQRHAIGGWAAPLGIELYADGLSALLVVISAVVAGLTSIYASGYFAAGEQGTQARTSIPAMRERRPWAERDAFWPLWLFLWAALNALFLSADAFNIYVALELVTLSGIALLVLQRGSAALAAGMRYLLAAFLGSLAYLLGVGLLYAAFDSLALATLAAAVSVAGATPAAFVALCLMTVGLALKTALFPLHFWLPSAHASAPAPVSAALSALVVKGSFYVLLRLWFGVFGEAPLLEAAQLLGLLGSLAIVWGSVQAIRARQLKLMIAHSTVAQVGYLFLVLPLAGTAAAQVGPVAAQAAADAWNGGAYQIASHALAKAAMFLAAGVVVAALAHDRLEGLAGLAARLPLTAFAFAAAGVSLVGLPPMGGFVAKLLLLNSAMATGQWWYAVVIVGGGILTAGYVFLIIGRAFSEPDAEEPGHAAYSPARARPVPRMLELVPFVLALLALGLGILAAPPLELLAVDSPFADPSRVDPPSAETGLFP